MGSNSGQCNSGQCTGGSTSAWPGAFVPVFKQHLILLHEPAGLCGYTGIGPPVSIYCISDMSPVLCIKGQGNESNAPAGLCGYIHVSSSVSANPVPFKFVRCFLISRDKVTGFTKFTFLGLCS